VLEFLVPIRDIGDPSQIWCAIESRERRRGRRCVPARRDCNSNVGRRRPVREVPGSLCHDREWRTPLIPVGELDIEFRDLLA
jgi:hypothetical protein